MSANSTAPEPLSQRYLTREEVADRYRTTVETVAYWHKMGTGPNSVKIGRRRLYPLDALETFEAEAQQGRSA